MCERRKLVAEKGEHKGHSSARNSINAPGFSLLELMMVMVLILLAATISQPIFQNVITHSREAALKDTLFTLRSMIHRFTLDHQRPPESLEEMVEKGYLGEVPLDPITRSRDTWFVDTEDFQLSSIETTLGVTDVHSGSDRTALDGTPYNSW